MKKNNMALIGLAAGAITLGSLFAACQPKTGAATSSQTETVPEEASISIANMTFSPDSLKVRPGASVVVTNKDIAGHSVTSDDGASFDTGIISQNGTVQFTAPLTSGTYTYHCVAHPSMKGTLIVE